MIDVIEIIGEVAKMASKKYLKTRPEAAPVKFFADNFLAINQELLIREKSYIGAKEKYPAILLFRNNLQERHENMKKWAMEATLHILIVTDAVQGNGDVQQEKVYKPVLYPICDCFFDAINTHPQIFTKGDTLKYDKIDKINLTAILGENKLTGDNLNGIELRNLRLKFKEKICYNF
jgi:hypothetical protein